MATITENITSIVTKTVASAAPTSTHRATPQGGILEGGNPSHYDPKNPIIIFIIQAGIILIFSRLLHYPLSLIRQPKVIAEVIGGVLLGPSVMGRIPGFSAAMFPTTSIPNLTLVANLGLVLFLFLVGLEVDLRYFVSNWKIAVSVGAAGMALPFGLGCAIAWGLFHEFRNDDGTEPIPFGVYMLFIGVAMSVTAFPVLCRILSELKLLSTPVGVIVLSAGVGNDVVGWILLALCVALVNAGSGLTALYVLLTCLGYALFLSFAVRPAFLRILRRTRALQDGPSQGIVALTLLMALTSAFFTGVIGVHPIFGAFMIGLICPHEGGFAIKITEKVEDLVSTLFLPLYFALSGLSTNLGLLNDGKTWAYVVGVIGIAFFAKFAGGMFAARLNGLVWRESATIGVLMSCKGLVELIVLNIGLQANILSKRTFTMFVVMALVTTVLTTPLTAFLYPPWYQRKLEAWKRGEIDWDTGALQLDSDIHDQKRDASRVKSVLVYLRLDTMPTLLAFVSLLGDKPKQSIGQQHPALKTTNAEQLPTDTKHPVEVHGLRLMELTERGSTVMKVSEVDEYSLFDPVINTFRVLGQLSNLAVSGEVRIVPESSYAETLITRAVEESTNLLILPWSETGSMSESQTISTDSVRHKLSSDTYANFVNETLDQAQTNTAVFINKGFSGTLKPRPSALQRSMSGLSMRSYRENATVPTADRSHHIFLPYFGGADGRVALRLVLQLVENPEVTATIVHYEESGATPADVEVSDLHVTVSTPRGKPQVVAVNDSNNARESASAFFARMQKSLPAECQGRGLFDTVVTSEPVAEALAKAQVEVGQNSRNGGDLLVVGRHVQLFQGQNSCLGTIASKVLEMGVKASLVVVQAGGAGLDA